MKITILTLFPEYFEGMLKTSILSRAIANGLIEAELVNFRDFTLSKHGHVDDTPYGGGAGMVLACQPILDALESVRTENSVVALLSPQGQTFNHQKALELSKLDHLILICGHYEGFDERIREHVDLQLSLGDFVLTGGEPAAAAMCDAIFRLVKGVIKEDSSGDDSFCKGLLEYPQYTKPADYKGQKVPEVLLSGHHANIAKWRREQALINTALHRPDLLESAPLDAKDLAFLEDWKESQNAGTLSMDGKNR
ncbi:tRNA (guanosine(37)-N1)-methyltransferase TrmD [Allobaculum mucilyticum]|uniref:tRNA (guanosine(37)-N1)-methyltransferase TrmD n=1 Tax=Allobaculum mucilyticum TaxID=2834459 RepID=UPI001E2F2A7E|nr:tRNA (guanosine(37)-N1)-methyltransferase TrmD [Allobaculum mucilyticum]UNT95710.1 tRNA (guanosine(37)-N1)-methyltransferase TrmD [Allobaculum mucilyticum]